MPVEVMKINFDTAKQIHNLLFTFMGLFHEKFLLRFRQESHEYTRLPCFKKNHMKILNVLYQGDLITLTEISKMLDIEKGSLTTLIDLLEKEDFVIRTSDPMDRRKTLIRLSSRGREEMDRVMDFCVQKMNKILHDIDSTEIHHFLTSLQSAVEFMKKV